MQLQKNYSLKSLNTFGLEAKANYFIEINSVNQLQEILTNKSTQQLPKLILGSGSNILFTQDYPGLVIHIAIHGLEVIKENNEHVYLKIGAGEQWHSVVLYCIQHHYAGIENLSLIPGTAGAAPLQNIGAYGVELKDVFDSLEAIHIADASMQLFTADDCQFGYRDSIFKNKYRNQFIITSIVLRLNKSPTFNISYADLNTHLQAINVKELSLKVVSDAVINIRQSKLPDPHEIGNAGSFFKNPEIGVGKFESLKKIHPLMPHYAALNNKIKVPAAWLIEQCAWKGMRRGNIGVHAKQALVLVNYGNGLGKDILQLSKDIQSSVAKKFDIALEAEVNIY